MRKTGTSLNLILAALLGQRSKWPHVRLTFAYIARGFVTGIYINNIQQNAKDAGIYYCKLTLHVSDVYRTHHEYIKL